MYYQNKLNGKLASEVSFRKSRVHFTIDGIKTSLETEIFEQYYELVK